MKKLLSALCALLMLGATAAPAYAHDHRGGGWSRGYDRGYDRGRHRGDDHGDAVAAGIIGLVVGAVIGSAASQPRYDRPPPQRYYGGCGPNPCGPPPQPYYEQSYQGGGYYGPQAYQGGYGQGGYGPEMCTVRERQWDPYAGRTLTIERQVPCN